MQSHAELVCTAQQLVQAGLPLTAQEASTFLQNFPIQFIFDLWIALIGFPGLRILKRNHLPSEDVGTICTALDFVLSSEHGSKLLPEMLDYITSALQSTYLEVRRLGSKYAAQLAREASVDAAAGQRFGALLKGLEDEDIVVGNLALKAAESVFDLPGALDIIMETHNKAIKSLLTSGTEVTRMRLFECLLVAASRSQVDYLKIDQAGLLDPLLKELDNYADPLSCLAAWSLFREIACGSLQRLENKADVTAAACRILSSRVLTMLSESDDVALICGMLSVAAPIISAGLATCDEGEAAVSLSIHLITYLSRVLENMESAETELVEAVLDAAGQVGANCAGAERIICDESGLLWNLTRIALTMSMQSSIRETALHSVASLAGSEWGQGETMTPLFLSEEAERSLETCLSSTAAENGGGSPGHVFWELLQIANADHRVAVYRTMCTLVVRPWFAGGVCLEEPLFNHLVKGCELDKRVAEWRYACIQRFTLTARRASAASPDNSTFPHRETLCSCLGRLDDCISRGPLGSNSIAEPQPVVATEMQ